MKKIPILALAVFLAGCAGLPPPAAPDSKVVAVYFQPGRITAQGLTSPHYELKIRGVEDAVRIQSGMNFLAVDSRADTATIESFRGVVAYNGRTIELFRSGVSLDITFPPGSSVALLPLVFSSREGKAGRAYQFFGDTTTMPPEQAQDFLEKWKKEQNGTAWTNLFIVPPLTF